MKRGLPQDHSAGTVAKRHIRIVREVYEALGGLHEAIAFHEMPMQALSRAIGAEQFRQADGADDALLPTWQMTRQAIRRAGLAMNIRHHQYTHVPRPFG
ncbi:hypothetical protein EKH55_1647 [Sinorhizobium alkalisoli]|nr:hypothetical protein EKH55_1647 [Sinorhizobium alkalisoli]